MKTKQGNWIVECENEEQTINVLNYVDEDDDKYWNHWKYVWYNSWESDFYDELECITEKYPNAELISFADWEKLPNEESKFMPHANVGTTLEEINNLISSEFDRIKNIVLLKNTNYGNSLHNPISVFQKDKKQGILGRLDDKLNRIKTVGITDDTEDTIDDLIGYLIHLNIMKKLENETEK